MVPLSLLVLRHAHKVVDDIEVVINHVSARHYILTIHQGSIVEVR